MDQQNKIKTTVELDVSNAERQIDKLNKAKSESASLDQKSVKSQGALSKAIEKTDQASGGLLTQMKALVTNPIGLVVTALVAGFKFLSTAVSRSGKASETFGKIGAKLSGILNGMLAVAEPLVEFLGEKLLNALNDPKQAIIDLGNSIKQNLINRAKAVPVIWGAIVKLFKGDLKGAAKDAADGFIQLNTGITDATDKAKEFGKTAKENFDKAAKATNNLANAEKRLAKIRIAAEKQQLISLRLAEEQRQIRDDTSKSIEDRIAANKRLGEVLDVQSQREIALAQQTLNLARQQQTATGDTLENIEAVGDAELALLEIRERITGQRSEQLTNENALLKEQAEFKQAQVEKALEEEAIAKAKKEEEEQLKRDEFVAAIEQQIAFDEIELERRRENGESTNELEKEILDNRAQIEINAKQRTADEIELIEAQAQLGKEKIDKAEVKLKQEKEAAVLDAAINGAGEAFGIAQELAVARALIEAPGAIAGSFKEAAKTYAPPLSLVMGALGAAGTVAPIISGLATIKNTRFSKKKGGSPSGSISSAAATGGGAAPGAGSAITPELVTDIAANNSARLGLDQGIGDAAGASAANNVLGGASANIVFSESRFSDFQNQVQFKEEKSTIS